MIAAERPEFSIRCRHLVRKVVQEHGLGDDFAIFSEQREADRLLANIPEDWPIADVADLFSLAFGRPGESRLCWAVVRWLRSDAPRKVHIALLTRVVGAIHISQNYINIARRFPQFQCECNVMVDECLRVWRGLKHPLRTQQ
jgi:hypothetical protein